MQEIRITTRPQIVQTSYHAKDEICARNIKY